MKIKRRRLGAEHSAVPGEGGRKLVRVYMAPEQLLSCFVSAGQKQVPPSNY